MATSKVQSDEIFDLVILDPDAWITQARFLKTSAQLLLDQLIIVQRGSTPIPERSDTMLTYMQSYMLLIGYSLENMVKGLLIAKLPDGTVKATPDILRAIKTHKILNIVPKDVKLSKEERNLLERLQIFAVWAGRYPMPLTSEVYHNAVSDKSLALKTTDPALIDKLFFKFDTLIADEIRKKAYNSW